MSDFQAVFKDPWNEFTDIVVDLSVHVGWGEDNHTTVSITSDSLKMLIDERDYVSVEELEALVILMKSARAGLGAPLCGVCKEPQFETPSGVTCVNGHGGADPLEEPV